MSCDVEVHVLVEQCLPFSLERVGVWAPVLQGGRTQMQTSMNECKRLAEKKKGRTRLEHHMGRCAMAMIQGRTERFCGAAACMMSFFNHTPWGSLGEYGCSRLKAMKCTCGRRQMQRQCRLLSKTQQRHMPGRSRTSTRRESRFRSHWWAWMVPRGSRMRQSRRCPPTQ